MSLEIAPDAPLGPCAAAAAAHAAQLPPDVTGYWYNPSESGWGAAIAQQGEVLFATLFVCGEQKRAAYQPSALAL